MHVLIFYCELSSLYSIRQFGEVTTKEIYLRGYFFRLGVPQGLIMGPLLFSQEFLYTILHRKSNHIS